MCDPITTDPTADFVLSDLLTVTEDLIDFSINLLDTIRLQSHFNDRNRRVSLAIQLKDVSNRKKTNTKAIEISRKPCTVPTTLKYDLAVYLDRILQACKRSKANLMLLRVARLRSTNATLLLFASTYVRVEQLDRKVQLLTRLVKENGGEFQRKKQKKKTNAPVTQIDQNKDIKQEPNQDKSAVKTQAKKANTLNLMSKEDLSDYVEVALSFRSIITKYYEFIRHIRSATKSVLSPNSQGSMANSIILIPIAANAINELNNILNRLIRMAFTIESESNYLRQTPIISTPNDTKELYRHDTKNVNTENTLTTDKESGNQTLLLDRVGSSRLISSRTMDSSTFQKDDVPRQHSNVATIKRNTMSLLKQNDARSHVRNQSAVSSTSLTNSTLPSCSSFKLEPNLIANIFEDIFSQ